MDCPRSAVRRVVMAFVSDDHNSEAGETAAREIIADVVLLNGTQGIQDLAFELGDKLAQLVEEIACEHGVKAVDLADSLFPTDAPTRVTASGTTRARIPAQPAPAAACGVPEVGLSA
jgi:hypothetical protein